MSTNEQTPLSQPTSVVQNTLGKEQIPQDFGRPTFDAALQEYCDKNYHQLLPIIAKKLYQKKVQQEKLKAVKARINFKEVSQHSELGTQSRRRDLKKRLGSGHRRVYSTGSKTRGRVCPHTRTTQGVGHTTVAIETLKAATRVLAQGKQILLLKIVITKEHPRKGWKRCQKVKIAHEDNGSQNKRRKSQALRMICPNHGKNASKIRSQFITSSIEIGNPQKSLCRDLLEEKKEHPTIQEAKGKAKMEKYYNARVRNTSFKPGDLVYQNNEASQAEDGGKLGPKWEGPYEVTEALGKGAYNLRDRNGITLPRTLNVCNLKKCYVHE
nr:reverse transcriptase domain-containing protein [Tanacetum cinerariifolium]